MKKIVLAKDLHPMFLSVMHFLNRSDITVYSTATAEELLKTHFEHRADLIVTNFDLPGMSCETLVNIIRRNEALKSVSIMVLFADRPDQRERVARCGANIAIAMPAAPSLLASHVSAFLDVEPRRAYRVVLSMSVEGIRSSKPIICSSENISATGMMIRTAEVLPRGSRFSCSFFLPNGTRVSADGDVARVINQGPGAAFNQYGVRFMNVSPDAESAIASFVNKDLQQKQPA